MVDPFLKEEVSSAKFTWNVMAPRVVPAVNALVATPRLVQGGKVVAPRDERISTIPPPPSGSDQVSDLPFLSATNGWGPVERDESNGENKAGDGKPLTMRGTVYAKGLGTNSPSDVQISLAGACSRFTATAGVDDEVGGAATVTFSVVLDGKVLTTTAALKGGGRPRTSTSRSPGDKYSNSSTAGTGTATTTPTGSTPPSPAPDVEAIK